MLDEKLLLQFPKTTATILSLLGFGIAVVCFLSWRSVSIPEENELIATMGTIAHVQTVTESSDDVVFRFKEAQTEYKYVDWYPHFQRVRNSLVVGQSLTVYTLPESDEIWRAQFEGRDLVSFGELVEARSGNRQLALILAIVLPIGTVIGLLDLWWRCARQRPPTKHEPHS